MKTIPCLIAALLLASCGSNDNNNTKTDAPVIHEGDAAIDGPTAPDCFTGTPTTHDQLINACPGAGVTRIIKVVHLPLLNADGTVPPLP